MKRKILLSFLAITIIGIVALTIDSNIGVKKHIDSKLVDLAGNRESLGPVKVISTSKVLDDYNSVKTTATKDGIISNKLTPEPDVAKNLDKKLMRGFFISGQNDKFSVALRNDKNKGLRVRYKNKAENKYEEFLINEDFLLNCSISNLYIKDDFVYVVINSWDEFREFEESNIVKISLNSKKMIGKIKLLTEQGIREYTNSGNKIIVKGNKMYIATEYIDLGVKLFILDLEKETVEYKNLTSEEFKNDKDSSQSLFSDDNYIYYEVFNRKEKNIMVLIYDVSTGKTTETTIKDKSFEKLDLINSTECKVIGNKLYLVGSVHKFDMEDLNPFTAVIDLSQKSLDYIGLIEHEFNFSHIINTDIQYN